MQKNQKKVSKHSVQRTLLDMRLSSCRSTRAPLLTPHHHRKLHNFDPWSEQVKIVIGPLDKWNVLSGQTNPDLSYTMLMTVQNCSVGQGTDAVQRVQLRFVARTRLPPRPRNFGSSKTDLVHLKICPLWSIIKCLFDNWVDLIIFLIICNINNSLNCLQMLKNLKYLTLNEYSTIQLVCFLKQWCTVPAGELLQSQGPNCACMVLELWLRGQPNVLDASFAGF